MPVDLQSELDRWYDQVRLGKVFQGADGRFLLPYFPFPRQGEFHQAGAKYRLFGGAAGPGKSLALLMEAILRAYEVRHSNTLLLRRTFPELESSLLLYFRRDVPHELYIDYNDSKHIVTWRNGSTTRFGYSQSDHDIYQYQGAEFLFIGVDELTLFSLTQWQFLTSRNRCPVPDSHPGMAATTNPGNIGHAWVKALWVDKQPPAGMDGAGQYDPNDYEFIPASVFDNPIYAGDAQYLKTLTALPDAMRRAFLDGDWNIFAGQYFDNFSVNRHVVRAEQIPFEDWWQRWISIDWGFEHPAAVHWHTAIPNAYGAVAGTVRDADSGNFSGKEAGGMESGPLSAEAAARTSNEAAGSHLPPAKPLTITYREFLEQHVAPRDVAHKIGDLYAAKNCLRFTCRRMRLLATATPQRLPIRWGIYSSLTACRGQYLLITIASAGGC